MKRSRKNTKDQMFSLIRKWESSGITQEQFFKEHGLARSTFSYWRKKYIKEKTKPLNKEGFIPIQVTESDNEVNTGSELMELIYPNGVRLVCTTNMDLTRLKPLIVL